jgi:hypothetical protein
VCHDLQQLTPVDERVIAALEEFHDFTPPQASLVDWSHGQQSTSLQHLVVWSHKLSCCEAVSACTIADSMS